VSDVRCDICDVEDGTLVTDPYGPGEVGVVVGSCLSCDGVHAYCNACADRFGAREPWYTARAWKCCPDAARVAAELMRDDG